MWMGWKARHRVAVVHAPTILAAEVLADLPAGQRCGRGHLAIALRIGVVVVGAEQERVCGFPGKAQGLDLQDGAAWHADTPVQKGVSSLIWGRPTCPKGPRPERTGPYAGQSGRTI